MHDVKITRSIAIAFIVCLFLDLPTGPSSQSRLYAQEDASTQTSPEADSSETTVETLAESQNTLAEKYQRLEMLMLKMAEVDANTNPRRAALLKEALTNSKDQQISKRMTELAALLRSSKLKKAVEDQGAVQADLNKLLDLLLSENRTDRLKDEQARVRSYIKEVERVLRQQRGVQGRTEGGGDEQRLSRDQQRVADRASRLADEIQQNEGGTDAQDSQDNQNENQDANSENSNDSEDGAQKSDANQSQNGQSQDAQSQENQDSQSQNSNGQNDGQKSVVKKDGSVVEGRVVEEDEEKIVLEDEDGNRTEIDKDEIAEMKDGDSSEPSDGDQNPEGQQSQGQQSQGQQSQGQQSQGQQSQGQQSQGQQSQGQQSQGQQSQGQQSQGQQSQGQQSQGQQQDQQQQQEAFPGQQEIQEAERQMREAEERLRDAEREEAVEAQREARRLLEQAKARLEEILRQMREEEIERTLAQLEGRFRKMLEMQVGIYEDTQKLCDIPADERDGQTVVESGKLSQAERKLLVEIDKSLLLLREEGSSVAFPEAIEQLREDVEQIVTRLANTRLDPLTLGLEEDVISALEEIVEALQKAQQDAEERRQQQQQQQQQQGQQGEPPLVDAIAELKMIRTLQIRVNRRTQTYAKLLEDPANIVGQATDEEVLQSLEQLSGREARIRQITRDILLERNK